jgi:hypothetical protein
MTGWLIFAVYLTVTARFAARMRRHCQGCNEIATAALIMTAALECLQLIAELNVFCPGMSLGAIFYCVGFLIALFHLFALLELCGRWIDHRLGQPHDEREQR